MKNNTKIKRRSFIRQTSLGILGLPLLAGPLRRIAPSDKVRIAIIGLGPQGTMHMVWFNTLPDVEVVALCDVDKLRLEKAKNHLLTLNPTAKVDTYTDFRHVLERKDIDAISCGTPDHWHAMIAIMAFQAGKDVYGEKPLSHNVAEAHAMLKTLQRYNSVFQLGTQVHWDENFRRVTEIIQSGKLGKIHTVRLWKEGGSRGFGFPENTTPPETLDWNMWLGPAPWEEYTPARCHGSYRHFLEYSGGVFADFWCHIADVMFMSLHPKGLSGIDSRGDRPHDGIADAPRWIDADFKFEDLDVYWTTAPPNVPGADQVNQSYKIGALFEGANGSLTCDYSKCIIHMGNEIMNDIPEVPRTVPRSDLPRPLGHQRDFINAVKSRKQPESNLAYAREMTVPMLLALISFRLKRKLVWDPVKEQIVGDEAASYLLSRAYRAPWSLPK